MEVNYTRLGQRLHRRARQIEAVKRVSDAVWADRIETRIEDPEIRAWVASILLWDRKFEAGEAISVFFDGYPPENDHDADELLGALRAIGYPDAALRASQSVRQQAPATDKRRPRREGYHQTSKA